MSQPEVRPVLNWPGFHVSQDGQVFSSRSRSRELSPVKVNRRGVVSLTYNGHWKQFKPEELAAEAWRPRWTDKL